MATRSNIGILNKDNTITSVYCHWDGYPSHNGKILLENYDTEEKVRELLKEGDISSLEPNCTKPELHSFENKIDGYTVYYGRDRGEENTKPKTDSALLKQKMFDNDYGYLFDTNTNKWLFLNCHLNYSESNWIPLTMELCAE
jgi:hypothetical protein